MTRSLLITLSALTLSAGMAVAAPIATTDSRIGEVVTAADGGMTLYTFRKDTAGTSNCDGGCARSWPPFFAASGAKAEGDLTIITRNDGKAQWALDGQPLYFWAADRKPGDVTGDGVGGVWDAARQ
ncbi:MAG: hypothetical protein AAFN59_03725 [Pseudomonadota bacterium]